MLTEFECLDDLNLDDNPNVQENYYLLCAPTRKYIAKYNLISRGKCFMEKYMFQFTLSVIKNV